MLLIADLSNNQTDVNLAHLKAVGVDAVIHKASEGTGFTDPWFERRRARAKALGIPFGAYHFADTRSSGEAEGKHFAEVVGKLGRYDLLPVLDLEAGDPAHTEAFARAFNREVEARLGAVPMFYSYPDYIARMRLTHTIGDGLWLASYSRNDGRDHPFMVPAPWRSYWLHQFTSAGKLNGVPFHVDLSHVNPHGRLPYVHPLLASV